MLINKELLYVSRSKKVTFWLIVVLGFASAIFTLIQAYLLSRIIHNVFIEKYSLQNVIFFIYIFIIFSALKALTIFFQNTFSHSFSAFAKDFFRKDLLKKIPFFLLLNKRTEYAVNVFLSGVDRLENYFAKFLPQFFLAILIPLFYLIIILPIDFISGIIFIFTAPIIPLFMFLIGSIAEKMSQKQWKTLRLLSAYFFDVIQGLPTIKLFNRSKEVFKKIEEVTDIFRIKTLSVLKIAFISALVMELTSTISVAIVAVAIGLRLLSGNFYFADALFILFLAPEFYLPMRQLGISYHSALDGLSAFDSIKEILITSNKNYITKEPGERKETTLTETSFSYNSQRIVGFISNKNPLNDPGDSLRLNIHTAPILFENVTLVYQERNIKALDSISFTIEPKKVTAIVGESGAGKTTIMNLLLKFLEPNEGTIKLGQINFKDINEKIWRKNLTWIPQNPRLFNKTILDNIRIARPDASDEEIHEAARRARIHELIISLPNGYNSFIGENSSKVSGGESQRIAIARAYLRDSPLILVDEPTANIDPIVEEEIIQDFFQLFRNRTVVIIAHRLNTIFKADKVVVLHNGSLVGYGSHNELIKTSSYYQKIFELYNERKNSNI